MRIQRSTVLLIAGFGLLFTTMVGSAMLAPDIGTGGGEGNLTLVGSQGGGPAIHHHGSVYLLNGTDTVWREDSADSYFEVEQFPDDTVIAGFMQGGYTDCDGYNTPCSHTGYRVIDPDGEPTVEEEYSFPVRSRKNSEVHAAIPLPDGGIAVSDMENERVFVRENGTITWEWSASSFYDAPPDPTRTDWLHINDIDYIGEDRFLVSVRNSNQILVIERGEGVVEVINEDRSDEDDDHCMRDGELDDYDGDGDIRCGDPWVLSHQHNPQWLGDGAVLVADSENDRVVELHRIDGQWEPVWAVSEVGNVEFHWPRDADRLPNGNTLITDSVNRRIVEVDENGDLVWSVSTNRTPYEADRLPVGESTDVPTVGSNGTVETDTDDSIPILTTLAFGAHAVVPSLPFWFGEMQVLGVLVAVVLIALGGGLRLRGWWRQRKVSSSSD